jgi:hypothetical protein
VALDFPSDPTTGDIYTLGDRQWRFNGTAWESVGSATRLPTTVPSDPAVGDMYFDLSDNNAYVYNGTAFVLMTLSGAEYADF